MCKISCNECSRKVFSTGVSVTTVNDVDTLVIDVPAQTFTNGQCGCLVIVQTIPATATIGMPVAISIGGDTTTVYPVVGCNCATVTACAIRARRRYPFKLVTSATGASFKFYKNLSCAPNNNLTTIPITTTTGG